MFCGYCMTKKDPLNSGSIFSWSVRKLENRKHMPTLLMLRHLQRLMGFFTQTKIKILSKICSWINQNNTPFSCLWEVSVRRPLVGWRSVGRPSTRRRWGCQNFLKGRVDVFFSCNKIIAAGCSINIMFLRLLYLDLL